MSRHSKLNRIEKIKQEKDGLDIGAEIERFARNGFDSITQDDLERLKWIGVFFRKQTPGFFMIRIRIPNGILNSDQFKTISWIVNNMGRGTTDVTTRQQIQLRWIKTDDIPHVLKLLNNADLLTLQTGMDNIRNVVGCPVSGISRTELFEASMVVRRFNELFVGNREYTNLPRKINVTITACMENCANTGTQDIALVPAEKIINGSVKYGFNILAGGKNGSGGLSTARAMDVFVTPEEAPEVCKTIVIIYRDNGSRDARNRARLFFLLEEWGIDKFREALETSLGRTLMRAGTDRRYDSDTDHIGVFPQSGSAELNYVGLKVPVGRLTGEQMYELAHLADIYGNGEIRLTAQQNVIVPNVHDRNVNRMLSEKLLQELTPYPSPIMRGITSCSGIEFCNMALIETKNRALRIGKELEEKLPGFHPKSINWSGCPSGCGNHTVAEIGLLGKKVKVDGELVDAVDIFIGGESGAKAKPSIKIMEDVPCNELTFILESLVQFGAFDKFRKQIDKLIYPDAKPSVIETAEKRAVDLIYEDEIVEGTGKPIVIEGREIAVFKLKGELYATDNQCPHQGNPLSAGALLGDDIICPGHGNRFSIKTGKCHTDSSLSIKTYRLVPNGKGYTVSE